ncbi:MAG: HEPN domain-containing protein [Prevotella sp.]|nr:HEPN domain-containing protein [Candidatus Prevotella equi]
MSLNEQQRKDLVKLYWDKATMTWDELEICEQTKRWNMAANRMYYALYHAVCALMVHDGHPVPKHKGSKQVLGERYILTGKMPTEYGRLYAQLATLRERADYDIIFKADEDIITSFKPRAEALIKFIETAVL